MSIFSAVNVNNLTIMKVNFLVMAMMIVGAMCGCTAHESDKNVEPGCDVFKTTKMWSLVVTCSRP